MNAVEIEEAISTLAEAPLNAETFAHEFLQAFGLNDAGIRKLRSGDTNKSDLRDGQWRGGVLQRNKNNIHLLACDFKQLPDRFTFFLSLAGISTVKRIDENAFDIRATGRLNKLYVELLKENPEWDTDHRAAHNRNDETLERIYIGRRFRNDTERLEKLFELYTQMTAGQISTKTPVKRKAKPS